VAAFSDAAIRAVVEKARYSEEGAADYITATLIKRRDKVLKTWLTGVNPIVNPKLTADGALTFENAAVTAGVASPQGSYQLTWSKFDNTTAETAGADVQTTVTAPRSDAPSAILQGTEFVSLKIRTIDAGRPEWASPVTVHFRRSADGWRLVGLSRRQTVEK
jgi:hypothetical protein